MMRLTPELCKLLEPALSLAEQDQVGRIRDSPSGGQAGRGGCTPLGEAENGKRIAELDSGAAETTSWAEERKRNFARLPKAFHAEAPADQDAAFDWYRERSPLPL